DITDGASEVLGEQMITGTLSVGDGAEISMTLSTENREGTRTIEVRADPDELIEEIDEDNNAATKTLTIKAASSGQSESETVGQSDGPTVQPSTREGNLAVAIDEVTAEIIGAATGGSDTLLTVAATVVNEGQSPVANLLVQFDDGTSSGMQRLAAIEAGGSVATSFSFVLPGEATLPALHPVTVTVDPYDTVAEADEGDNVAAVEVDVAALGSEGLEVSVVR
ncbi:MAG: hypothetical protein KDE19_04265, partial [Caldilineaceae bacterium]|nr:hypothetical protein [Caldilineaceae bacterium]